MTKHLCRLVFIILLAATASLAASPAPVGADRPDEALRQLLKGSALGGAAAAQPSEADKKALAEQAEIADAARRRAEEEKKRDGLFSAEMIPLAESLARDGELSADDRTLLSQRARSLGYEGQEADKAVDRAALAAKQRGEYASLLRAALADARLDPGEEEQLRRARSELGIPEALHARLVESFTAKAMERARDPLAELKEKSLTTELVDRSLELFGRKLFAAGADAFAPSSSAPPSEDYPVGAGDVFQVYLWGRVEAAYSLTVGRDGTLQFPQVGPLRLEGLTYAEARNVILQQAKSVLGANATVVLSGARTIGIFVVGEVESPGLAAVSPSATVVQALMKAGGPTPLGSLRHVKIKRGKKILADVDLYKFITDGEPGQHFPLREGDVVVVPRADRLVELHGEVRRPAVYELLDGEGLGKLLALGGGLTPRASAGRIQVSRNERNRNKVVLDAQAEGIQSGFELLGGDTVRVFPFEGEVSNTVRLMGHVHQGGIHAHREGLRVSDLVGGRANLKERVDLGYALILREDRELRRRETVVFDLGKALAAPGTDADPPLRPLDEVFVFSADRFREPAKAMASGEVRSPGTYRIEKGFRVGDLLRLAGGLTEEGHLAKAELLRRHPETGEVSTLYVDLKAALEGDERHNVELADNDLLRVAATPSLLPRQYVFISGEVGGARGEREDSSTVERFLKGVESDLGELAREQRREERHAKALGRLQTGAVSSLPEAPKEQGAGQAGAPLTAASQRVLLTKGMRVSDLVFKAGGLTKNAHLELAHIYRTDPVTKKTSVLAFHLGKALALDPQEDRELADLDQVVVYSAYDFHPRHYLEVAGSVVNPGLYPFSENMTVRDLLLMAGGLKEEAFLYSAELARHKVEGNEQGRVEVTTLDLVKVLAGDGGQNIALTPYDKLYVRQIRDWNRDRQVRLEGEVAFPGVYPIFKGEKLSSVLRRAGGFTSRAHLAGAFFARESAKLNQESRLALYRRQLEEQLMVEGAATVSGSLDKNALERSQRAVEMQRVLLNRMENVRATGRIVIRLAPPETLEGTEWDVVLEDNDYLSVPMIPATVEVLGAVYNPSSILWDADNRSVAHYLEMAGGPTSTGDGDGIYVIKADGSVVSASNLSQKSWWGLGGIEAEPVSPGDTVLVPTKIPEPSALSEIAQVTQVLYQIGIAAGVMIAIF